MTPRAGCIAAQLQSSMEKKAGHPPLPADTPKTAMEKPRMQLASSLIPPWPGSAVRLQVLKRHFAATRRKMVEQGCGVPKGVFLKTPEAFVSASGRNELRHLLCRGLDPAFQRRADYRSAAILQLLRVISGRPGGGILALADMLRSRCRPTSPRSTICCPAPAHAGAWSRGKHAGQIC